MRNNCSRSTESSWPVFFLESEAVLFLKLVYKNVFLMGCNMIGSVVSKEYGSSSLVDDLSRLESDFAALELSLDLPPIPCDEEGHDVSAPAIEEEDLCLDQPIMSYDWFLQEQIVKEKRRDLEVICQNLVSRSEVLGEDISYQLSSIECMGQIQIHDLLSRLERKISSIMAEVEFLGLLSHPPRVVLRTPSLIQKLFCLRAFICLKDGAASLFEDKEKSTFLLNKYIDHQSGLSCSALEIAAQLSLPKTEALRSLLDQTSAFSRAVEEATSPDEFYGAFVRAVAHATSLAEKRTLILESLHRSTKKHMEIHSSFFWVEGACPGANALMEWSIIHDDGAWIESVRRYYKTVAPQVSIVRWVQEFLTPYLERKITEKTEDSHRLEISAWIFPRFRASFPRSRLRDDDIVAIALSAYLKMGSKGVSLESLKNTYTVFSDELDLFSLSEKERDELSETNPQVKRALDTEKMAQRHLAAYTKALRHSLPIDFTSLCLDGERIARLAMDRLHRSASPLSSTWMFELNLTIMNEALSPCVAHKFPWS